MDKLEGQVSGLSSIQLLSLMQTLWTSQRHVPRCAQCQDLALRVVVIDTLGHLSLVVPKVPWCCDQREDCLMQPKQMEVVWKIVS